MRTFRIARNLSLGLDKIWAEVAKCDVLCKNCHTLADYELNRQKKGRAF